MRLTTIWTPHAGSDWDPSGASSYAIFQQAVKAGASAAAGAARPQFAVFSGKFDTDRTGLPGDFRGSHHMIAINFLQLATTLLLQ